MFTDVWTKTLHTGSEIIRGNTEKCPHTLAEASVFSPRSQHTAPRERSEGQELSLETLKFSLVPKEFATAGLPILFSLSGVCVCVCVFVSFICICVHVCAHV